MGGAGGCPGVCCAEQGEALALLLLVMMSFLIMQTLPPALLDFFARFFALWNGSGRRDLVFDILAYAPFHIFQGTVSRCESVYAA